MALALAQYEDLFQLVSGYLFWRKNGLPNQVQCGLCPLVYRLRIIVPSGRGALWQNRPNQHSSKGARLPPDTKHPESRLHRIVPLSTPQERTRIINIFSPGSNNKNKFTILSPFHITRVLRNTLLQYQVQSAEFKQWNYNKPLTIEYKDPSVPTRRILHTTAIPQATPTTGVNKP